MISQQTGYFSCRITFLLNHFTSEVFLMLKKLRIIISVLCLTALLASCGNTENNSDVQSSSADPSSKAETSSVSETDSKTESETDSSETQKVTDTTTTTSVTTDDSSEQTSEATTTQTSQTDTATQQETTSAQPVVTTQSSAATTKVTTQATTKQTTKPATTTTVKQTAKPATTTTKKTETPKKDKYQLAFEKVGNYNNGLGGSYTEADLETIREYYINYAVSKFGSNSLIANKKFIPFYDSNGKLTYVATNNYVPATWQYYYGAEDIKHMKLLIDAYLGGAGAGNIPSDLKPDNFWDVFWMIEPNTKSVDFSVAIF